jgi:hypothetical protein
MATTIMPGTARKWHDIIQKSEKHYKSWHERCDKIEKKYALYDERAKSAPRAFQLFWANIEVLKPSVYARVPVPAIQRRFTDTKDVIGRTASELLERTCITTFEFSDLDGVMQMARNDLLLYSRGVAWVRYEADGDDDDGTVYSDEDHDEYDDVDEGDEDDEIDEGSLEERVCIDFLDRTRFGHSVASKWIEVDCVWRIDYLSRAQMIDRFKPEDEARFFATMNTEKREDEEIDNTFKVYQLWCKSENKVVWLHMDNADVLDEQNATDVMDLSGFFPCPKPAYGTLGSKTLKPVPDYVYYQDQLDEINELTGRIAALQQQLRLRGFYNAGAGDIKSSVEKAMSTVDDGAILVPIKDMTQVGTQGIASAIMWIPIEKVAEVIVQLIALRKQLISDVYEIIGISDIQRGSSDPNETLGAQRLKAQNGSVRVRERQLELQRFARDLTRIIGEVIAENFAPETLNAMSQMNLPMRPPPMVVPQFDPATMSMMSVEVPAPVPPELEGKVTIDDVVDLLRDDRARSFKIEIETDSTLQPDEDAEKSRRVEFMTALSQFLPQAIQAVSNAPETAPLIAESLRFVVGGFRAGRLLEGVIDELAANIEQQSQQAQSQQKPDPDTVKTENDIKLDTMRAENDIQIANRKADNEIQIAQMKAGLQASQNTVLPDEVMQLLTRIETLLSQTQPPAPIN